jgi:hypothetical protein
MAEGHGSGGAIVPVEQRTIDFYGDELVAVRDEDGVVWVPVRRLCEALGVALRAQLARIERDPVMNEVMRSVSVTVTDGRTFGMACLPLKYVRAWLFGINATRVKPELREKLIQYQREVIEVIDRHFNRAVPDDMDERIALAMRDNALQQAKLWEAIAEQRRTVRATQELAEDHEVMLAEMQREIGRLQQAQAALWARLDDPARLLPPPDETITATQQAKITGLVNDIAAAAELSGQRLGRGKSDHAAVWGTLKRRFNVAKYQDLTQAQFGQVVLWLEGWLATIRGEAQA